MAENTYPVKPIGVQYICDVCTSGQMEYVQMVFSGPPENRQTEFQHKCSNKDCGHEQTFPVKYPYIRHVIQGGW